MNVQDLFNEDVNPEQMRQNLMSMLRAATSGQEATLDFGSGAVTLSYPEARFMAGKYRAYQKAGRQEEFIRAMGDARLFDRHMKQLRDLIDRQKNFRGSVPGERNVPGETTRPGNFDDFKSDARSLAKQLARKNPSDPVDNFVKGGKQLGIFKEQDMVEGSLEEIDRRGFLKGLGAAVVAGGAGSALGKESLPAELADQDLGDGFVATSVDVAGFTVRAVLDTTTKTYLTVNRRPEGGGAIIRNMAPFIMIRDGKVDMVMRVGPKTQAAMKKAGLLQDVDEQGVAEGIGGMIAGSVSQFVGNKIDPLHGEIMRAHGEMAGRKAEYTIRKYMHLLQKALKQQLDSDKDKGVAEGNRFDEPLTGYHIVYKNSGNPVSNTPSFETKDQAQKYLMTKMFANHQDFKVVHTAKVGMAEGDPKSHQARATLKHLKTQSYGDRADAANIKPGVKGFKDRYDMLQRAKALGNLKGDDDVSEGSTTKKKESGDITGTGRTERIMRQLRAQYPFAGSDIEALLYAFRSGQRRDRQDIDRLDRENDQEEAEIDDIERTLQKSGIA